jgi:hypothetical protein
MRKSEQIIKGFEYSLIDFENNSIGAIGKPGNKFAKYTRNPKFIVIHSTGGPNFKVNLDLLSSKVGPPDDRVCAHYMIARNTGGGNGLIYQMVDERLRGVHANALNDQSIGIELIDDGKVRREYPTLSSNNYQSIDPPQWLIPEQYLSTLILCLDICKTYNIQTKYFSCYKDINNNPNIINLSLDISNRTNQGSSSGTIKRIKEQESGIIFHKDFRSDKNDPIDFNGIKFINDLNKKIKITITNEEYNYQEVFLGLINNTIKISDIKDFNFELIPNSKLITAFDNLLKSGIKDSLKKRKDFEKQYNQTSQSNIPFVEKDSNKVKNYNVVPNDSNGN